MGFRTVVMLNNDTSHEWASDPKLGEKIQQDMNNRSSALGQYGRVVQCVHADTQSLVKLDRYTNYEELASSFCTYGPSTDEDLVNMLREAANKLGYNLTKKRKK